MATKKLFSSLKKFASRKVTKATDTTNQAGGIAYSLSDHAALAQIALTGTFNGTFYTSDEEQLKTVLTLANKADPKFVAKLAVYAHQEGLMKDTPAVLAAVVANRSPELLSQIFSRVIDNPKMLRNFVQVIRSGAVGRRSLGTRPKKLIQNYLESLTDKQLFNANIGNDPSLQDIIKLVHPKPTTHQRSAMYGYLLGKEYNVQHLEPLVREFEAFKKNMSGEMPNVPFQMLTALPLTNQHWLQIAEHATFNQVRMNLNTFARHGVLTSRDMVVKLAKRLSNPELVRKSNIFPYQLFTTYQNVDSTIPVLLTNALQDAADFALDNVPAFNGQAYVMVDTSGSMANPVTGDRGSVSTKTRCIDVAALLASALLRKNPNTQIIPFDTEVHVGHRLNPRDSIMTNARTLASFGGGGTSCASALAHVNANYGCGDLVIYISDNQSWFDSNINGSTSTMNEWNKFKSRNPNAKLLNINIQPYTTSQIHNREDTLNIGGFSDQIFDVISHFVKRGNNKDLWVQAVEAVQL